MSDEPNDDIQDEDSLLSELIRSAREREEKYTRPADGDILAYLLGTATGDQLKRVRAALVASESFRSEMLHLAQDVESLERGEVLARDEDAERIAAPELSTFIRQQRKSEKERRADRRRSLFRSILDWLSPPGHFTPILATASAVVVVVVLVLRNGGGPGPSPYLAGGESTGAVSTPVAGLPVARWRNVDPHVEKGYLVGNVTRGLYTPKPYSNARGAAIAMFREMLKETGDSLSVKPSSEWPRIEGRTSVLLFSYENEAGAKTGDFAILTPVLEGAESELTAWLLLPRQRALFDMPIRADSISVPQPALAPTAGCIVLTYRTPEGYKASPGFPAQP